MSKGKRGIPPNKRKRETMRFSLLSIAVLLLLLFASCSFDYGESSDDENGLPDLIMTDVEYVRVRSGDPQVRFLAELAERYEKKQIMNLKNFSFEQFDHEEKINASGNAGSAHVELESGNVELRGGVAISVESEDFTVKTGGLNWHDKDRILSGDPEDEVNVLRHNGTDFFGKGFIANARKRTWEFSSGLKGTYIYDDEEEEAEGEAAESVSDSASEETGEEYAVQ